MLKEFYLERKVPYKRPLKEGHVEGYHQNSPGFLSGFRTPSQVPSVGIPDIGSLAHSDSFLFFFLIIYKQEKKRKTKKQINFLKMKNFIWEFPKIK
jgi:hypothetical protein